MKSIIQQDRVCYVCGSTLALHKHHIIYGAGRRNISEQNGFTIWLCPRHHNMSDKGVHFDKRLDLLIKRICQRKYEEAHTREEWMRLVGKNYL